MGDMTVRVPGTRDRRNGRAIHRSAVLAQPPVAHVLRGARPDCGPAKLRCERAAQPGARSRSGRARPPTTQAVQAKDPGNLIRHEGQIRSRGVASEQMTGRFSTVTAATGAPAGAERRSVGGRVALGLARGVVSAVCDGEGFLKGLHEKQQVGAVQSATDGTA